MRKGDDIRGRTFRFGCDIVAVSDRVAQSGFSANCLSTRSGTSIGANLEEADGAQSRADFISKCTIALKEARECHDWFRLLAATQQFEGDLLIHECDEIVAILTTIVKNTRRG